MTKRTRKFFTIPIILIVLVLWSWGALIAYETLFAAASMGWVLLFFAVAGAGWFLPAALVISWAERPDLPKS